jgi:anti-sigma B factor antagonist
MDTVADRTGGPQPLQIVVQPQLGQMHITLLGDLDMATAPLLANQLQAIDPDCEVVIDLALLTFLDSIGLGVFVAEHKRLEAHGHKLTIYSPPQRVQRLFELTGLDRVFAIEP